MTYRLLGLTLATTFFLLTTSFAFAGSFTAGSPSPSSQSSGPASAPTQNQMPSAATNVPQTSQPAATGDTKPLTNIANAGQRLASASVEDMLGRPIGRVQSIRTDTSGTPTSVQVALNTQTEAGKIVQLPASQLRYDTRSRVVVAQFTQTEIDAMPATSPRSGAINEPGTMNQPGANTPASPSGATQPGY